MIRVAYIEDDDEMAKTIHGYLARYGKENSLSIEAVHFDKAEKLVYAYQSDYDLPLLDIQLSGMSGYQAAEIIRKSDQGVALIFITSLAQYAIKGYEVDALDFIVKPVTYYQFALKMNKAVKHIRQNHNTNILVSSKDGMQVLSSREIYFIEVVNHDLIYHLEDKEIKARGSLSGLAEQLKGQSYVRASVSHLVNMEYIIAIHGNEITMHNGSLVFISRAKKKNVLAQITRYLGGC